MTVLTTAILEEEKKEKAEEELLDSVTAPVIDNKSHANIAVVTKRRKQSLPAHKKCIFIITLLGLLCALGGLCYGIYHFAKLGQHNRHRVFCRVIEASPIRRTRIIAEQADISNDGHSLQLFAPSFSYAHQTYRASSLLIIDEHDIAVFKVESRRQCFVKQPSLARRRMRSREWAIFQWFRRLEEGSYFPNLHLLRRKWLVRTPYISHIEAGRIYHPKVAEFCKEMRVYRMVEVLHERIGVIPYGGGLLPKCPLRKCVPCPGNKYVRDRQGCRTCQCAFMRGCPPVSCNTRCPLGRVRDSNGCPTCHCIFRSNHKIAKRSANVESSEKETILRVDAGFNPMGGEMTYELMDIVFEKEE